ncbi:hypothetical protein [Kitasatospora brasiliensis]|uniref:hypothetical protein n=1 Tax=Kitasatospora brasiliensis TaxID=3058040 RepID=UPI00292D8C50|nr:hypothetical protein [Kitasatospora sp. K002]
MRTSRAVLLGAALLAGVGAAHLALNHRYQRQRTTLTLEDMNQRLAGDAHPEWYADHPLLDGLDRDTRARLLHIDRSISLTAAKYRIGQIPDGELDFILCVLAIEPAAQTYWQRLGRRLVDEARAGDSASRRLGEGLVRAFGEPPVEQHAA